MGKYIGNFKVVNGRFGRFLAGFFNPEGLEALNNAAREGFVSIRIAKRKEPSEKGYTHYAQIDDRDRDVSNSGHKYPKADNPRNYNHQNTDLSDNYGPVGQDDIPF